MEPITFHAIIPPIQSAASFGDDGCRLKLDIPESDADAAHELTKHGKRKVLRVTVEIVEDSGI